jgi:epoxyqueuosine reductase
MITKNDLIQKAMELGFDDIGFTNAEPFNSQSEFLNNENAHYGWTEQLGLTLKESIDPLKVMDSAKGIIVLLHGYFTKKVPQSLLANYGRCYLTDDRVTKDGLALRIKAFRNYLRENGVDSKLSKSMPDKLAAARAGVGTFGKNCLLFASRSVKGSSWISPVVIVVDREFEADSPSIKTGCPEWCRSACVAACPTRALAGNGKIDSTRCISYLSYHGDGLTPMELREPMGMYIYGCDRCQNVCPRNQAWISLNHQHDDKLEDMAEKFSAGKILAMDKDYFVKNIWPRMFYMSPSDMWRWKMNAARALGNSLETAYIPDLAEALAREDDERVKCMSAWALGRIGGAAALDVLKKYLPGTSGLQRTEIESAIKMAAGTI